MNRSLSYPATNLSKHKVGDRVHYRVSYQYNGGIVVGGKHYRGYRVPPPILPEGTAIAGLGIGLCLNHMPPLATGILVKKEKADGTQGSE